MKKHDKEVKKEKKKKKLVDEQTITDIAGLQKVAKDWCNFQRTYYLKIGTAHITVSSGGNGEVPVISMEGWKTDTEDFAYIGIIKYLEGSSGKQNAQDFLDVYEGKKLLSSIGQLAALLISIVEISEMIRGSAASEEFQRVLKLIASGEITWRQGFVKPEAQFVWVNSSLAGLGKTIQLKTSQSTLYTIKNNKSPLTENDKTFALNKLKDIEKKQEVFATGSMLNKELHEKKYFRTRSKKIDYNINNMTNEAFKKKDKK